LFERFGRRQFQRQRFEQRRLQRGKFEQQRFEQRQFQRRQFEQRKQRRKLLGSRRKLLDDEPVLSVRTGDRSGRTGLHHPRQFVSRRLREQQRVQRRLLLHADEWRRRVHDRGHVPVHGYVPLNF
jgi:hypothetical protein